MNRPAETAAPNKNNNINTHSRQSRGRSSTRLPASRASNGRVQFRCVGSTPERAPTPPVAPGAAPTETLATPATGCLPVARVRINEKQVFVTNLDPSVDAKKMFVYLNSKNIKPKWVAETKTASDDYSSFIIAVTELSLAALFDRDHRLGLWANQTLIREHDGRRNYTVVARHPHLPTSRN